MRIIIEDQKNNFKLHYVSYDDYNKIKEILKQGDQ